MWRLSLFSSSFVRAGLCKFITWWIASGEWNHGLQRFPSNLWGSISLINGFGTRPFKAHQSYILQCKWGRYSMTMKSGRHKRFSRNYHQFLVLTNRFTFFCIQNFFDANMVSTLERIYLTLPKILYYSYHGKLLTLKTPNGIHFRRLTNINRMHTKLSWMPFFRSLWLTGSQSWRADADGRGVAGRVDVDVGQFDVVASARHQVQDEEKNQKRPLNRSRWLTSSTSARPPLPPSSFFLTLSPS